MIICMCNPASPDDMPELPPIEIGVYRHYKGQLYGVVGICLNSESLEPFVLYSPLYDSKVTHWVRPYDMFTGTVDVAGKQVPRFEKVGP
jgi:hypothetical protein